MSDQNVPTPPNGHLSPFGTRAVAAIALQSADPTPSPATASTVVDILDTVSGAVLAAAAVVSPPAARAVLAILWGLSDERPGARAPDLVRP